MDNFLNNNSWEYRFLRTVLQAALGFIADNIAMIIASTQFDPTVQAMIVAVTMAVLSPIMAKLGTHISE